MKHTATKLIAMLLATMMVFALAIPMVSAEASTETATNTATTPSYPTYEEAAVGDLLYKVDFRGTDGIYAPKVMLNNGGTTNTVTPSDDGTSLTLKGMKDFYYGGILEDFDLTKDTTYTIEWKVTHPSATVSPNYWHGLYVDMYGTNNCYGFNGIGGKSNGGLYYTQGSATQAPGMSSWGSLNNTPKNFGTEAAPTRQFKMLVDGKNETIHGYVMMSDGKWEHIVTASLNEYNSRYAGNTGDKLCLVFRYFHSSLEGSITYSDVEVRKGEIKEVANQGELLLDLDNLMEDKTGYHGAVYTSNVDQQSGGMHEYNYDSESDTHTISAKDEWNGTADTVSCFGGTTNLAVGKGQKYTIFYSTKQNINSRVGLAYNFDNYSRSPSVCIDTNTKVSMMAGKQAPTAQGSLMSTWITFDSNVIKPDSDGYLRTAIEIDGNYITVYVNGVKQFEYTGSLYKDGKTETKNVVLAKGVLSLVFHTRSAALDASLVGQDIVSYKDLKVYSGLMLSENYVKVIDGDDVKTETIEGEEYELPSVNKTGYVFKGWKVNGAETVTAAGTKITGEALAALDTIEAVYTKIMSENFYQFRAGEDGKKDIRVVSVIDSVNYAGIGYTVTMKYTVNGEEKTVTQVKALKNVYESITAKYGTETYDLEKLGFDKNGGYITAFVIGGIPAELGTLTVELTPYQIAIGETTPVEGETVTVTFDLVNETKVEN